jgi:hypothetical protein
MKIKWEYKVVLQDKFFATAGKNRSQQEQDWLCLLGQEGWELIIYQNLSGDNDRYVFKRTVE